MLRAIFIIAGVALIANFWWLLLVFGVFLVCTGFKVLRHRPDEGTHGHDRAVKLLQRFMPVSNEFNGHHFFTEETRSGRPRRCSPRSSSSSSPT